MILRVIDTETCGLQGGVVEVASVDVINGQIVNPMSDLILPDRSCGLPCFVMCRTE